MTQIALQVAAAGALNAQNDIRVARGFDPAVVAATTNGLSVDLQGYESATLVIHAGVCTDGEYTVTIEDSPDNSVWTAHDGLDAAFTVITSTADEAIESRRVGNDITGTPTKIERYVRCVVTETSAGATGVVFSAAWVLGKKRSSLGDNVL
jgi:hypothetical protein